jgi:hypothetical protein
MEFAFTHAEGILPFMSVFPLLDRARLVGILKVFASCVYIELQTYIRTTLQAATLSTTA